MKDYDTVKEEIDDLKNPEEEKKTRGKGIRVRSDSSLEKGSKKSNREEVEEGKREEKKK